MEVFNIVYVKLFMNQWECHNLLEALQECRSDIEQIRIVDLQESCSISDAHQSDIYRFGFGSGAEKPDQIPRT